MYDDQVLFCTFSLDAFHFGVQSIEAAEKAEIKIKIKEV